MTETPFLIRHTHLILWTIILWSFTSTGQTTNTTREARLDSIKKHKLIYLTNTTIYSYSKSGGNAKSYFIDFKIGEEGSFKKTGRKGKNLFTAIKEDKMASEELTRAYKVHLRKKRICNTMEYVSYLVAFGSLVPFFIGLDDYETEGITGMTIGGGIGVVAGWTGIYVFKARTDKHLDDFVASVNRSVEIYNQNLLQNIK